MHGSGQITFGGVAFAGVVGDITLDDGTKWHFSGYVGEIGTPNVGYGNFEGDFPGTSHMAGSCALEIVDGGIGPGGAQITWYDLHGQIGTVVGYVFGGGADFGLGGGTWTESTSDALTDEQTEKLAKKVADLKKH